MFVFEAISGGILYDMVKEGLDITTKFLKNKLKASVIKNLSNEDLELIVGQVNSLSDDVKSNRDKFENAINSNSELDRLLSKIKDSENDKEDNKIKINNSSIEKSPIINIASGDVSINYGKDC